MTGTMKTRAHPAPGSDSPPSPNFSVTVNNKHPETHTSPKTLADDVRISARIMSEKGTGE